jgi:uncharacterized protein
MPKHLFKKLFPEHKVRNHKYFKKYLKFMQHNYLWHMNRHTTARAFFVGMFAAFMPMPMQMFLAAAMALKFKANLPISVLLVWLSNPFTYVPVFYFSYRVGLIFVGTPINYADFIVDWDFFHSIWQPLLIGSLINGLVFGMVFYLGVLLFWRIYIVAKYKKRRH